MEDSSALEATPPISDVPCPECKGIGFYKKAVPFGHPDFSKLFPCGCRAEAREQQRLGKLFERSNLSSYHDKTFETFNSNMPGVQRAFMQARRYAQNPRGWFVMFGKCGVGKTHLAAAIGNELFHNRAPQLIFAVVPDLLDHLRSTFGPTSELDYDEIFTAYLEVDVLILDDFGTQNSSAWAREKLYQLINHRYRFALSTVITSNQAPEDIERRVFSRMSDRALCEEHLIIDAEDFRRLSPEKRYQRFPTPAPRRRYQ